MKSGGMEVRNTGPKCLENSPPFVMDELSKTEFTVTFKYDRLEGTGNEVGSGKFKNSKVRRRQGDVDCVG